MAVPSTLKFGAGLFYLGDGATPEVFTKICGVTSYDVEVTKDTNDASVPDCDNPDAAIWTTSDVTSQGWKMSVEGFAVPAALPLIEGATLSSAAVGIRFYLKGAGVGAGTPDRLYSGTAHVSMKLTGKLGDKWQVSVEVTGDGALTIASAAIPA